MMRQLIVGTADFKVHRPIKDHIDVFDHFLARTEVVRQSDQLPFFAILIIFILLHKQRRIGVTEAVDRLFDIAHHIDVVMFDQRDEIILQVIGILIFIDQYFIKAFGDLLSYFRVVSYDPDRHMEDVREGEHILFLLEGGKLVGELFAKL